MTQSITAKKNLKALSQVQYWCLRTFNCSSYSRSFSTHVSSSLIAKMASCFAAVALPDHPQKDWDLSSLRLKHTTCSFSWLSELSWLRHNYNCTVLGWGKANFMPSSSPRRAICKGNPKLTTWNYHYKMQSLHCQFYTKGILIPLGHSTQLWIYTICLFAAWKILSSHMEWSILQYKVSPQALSEPPGLKDQTASRFFTGKRVLLPFPRSSFHCNTLPLVLSSIQKQLNIPISMNDTGIMPPATLPSKERNLNVKW